LAPSFSTQGVNNLTIDIAKTAGRVILNTAVVATGAGAVRAGASMITKNSYVRGKAMEAAASLIGDYGGVESQLGNHLSDGLPKYEITSPIRPLDIHTPR
jgi:hypothetical protein